MRRISGANLVTTLHFTADWKQLLNGDFSGYLISKTLSVGTAAMLGAHVENLFTNLAAQPLEP